VPAINFNSLIGAENWNEGVETLHYNRAINRQKFDYDALSGELQEAGTTKHEVYTAYQKLLRARTGEPLFSPLVDQLVLSLDSRVFALIRTDGENKVLALTNVSDASVSLDGARVAEELGKSESRDIISATSQTLQGDVKLAPYQTVWLK
jgi:sucrose phosphorylase